jgi:hypothetical protein
MPDDAHRYLYNQFDKDNAFEYIAIGSQERWTAMDASILIYTETCPTSIAFFVPKFSIGFQASILYPGTQPRHYHELVCILSAVRWVIASFDALPGRIGIITNCREVYRMFNEPPTQTLDPVLYSVLDLIMKNGMQIRVFAENVADDTPVRALDPGIQIKEFAYPW